MSDNASERIDGAATVTRRNGAWLISCNDPAGDTSPEGEWDAAANLRVAKRVARRMADEVGYTGPFRWRERGGVWWLSATDVDDGHEFRSGEEYLPEVDD